MTATGPDWTEEELAQDKAWEARKQAQEAWKQAREKAAEAQEKVRKAREAWKQAREVARAAGAGVATISPPTPDPELTETGGATDV